MTFTLSLPLLSWSNWRKTEDTDDEALEEDLEAEAGELLKNPEELLGEFLNLELDLFEVDLLDTPDELLEVLVL